MSTPINYERPVRVIRIGEQQRPDSPVPPEMLAVMLQCCAAGLGKTYVDHVRERIVKRWDENDKRIWEAGGVRIPPPDVAGIEVPAFTVEFIGTAPNGDWLFAGQGTEERA